MKVVWILGSGGLLGTAIKKYLDTTGNQIFEPAERFCWEQRNQLYAQLESAVKAFSDKITPNVCWTIYWAAGIGTMGSKEPDLASESEVLAKLLGLIKNQESLSTSSGSIIFASSAGAIYAGATDNVITESTIVAPTTPYAHEKLKQECLLSSFAKTSKNTSVLLARISTLYGVGQAEGKRQGLFAEIARRILRNQPIQIYVPFDTIRDYISSDEAAAKIVVTADALTAKSDAHIKIIASEQPTTIAEIIMTFKRVSRRTPRVIVGSNKMTNLYSRQIQFKSITLLPQKHFNKTNLMVGISQVLAAERLAFVKA